MVTSISSETDEVLSDQREDGSLWLFMNRPAALNSLTDGLVAGLAAGIEEASRDMAVRAVVISGVGRAFCAGADLKYAVRYEGDQVTPSIDFLERVAALLNAIETAPQPVVAAVNGLALAGGLEIVLACDLVFAAESANFGDAHANYGLIPGGGASARLPRKVGPTRAKWLLFSGEFISAARAEQLGIVNEVVPDDQLGARVSEVVATLASKSPLGLKRMKELVNGALEQPLSTALRAELLASELHYRSLDMREGLEAFAAKRPPRFSGH